MSSVQDEKPPTETPMKTSVRDIRNTELVSRLLAATPPYLYSALPLQPHAFFFSEMLRSFVNARHCRPGHFQRRFKRRAHKYYAENEDWRREWKPEEEKKEPEPRIEVPLELTVDKQPRIRVPSPRMSPKDERKSNDSPDPPRQTPYVDVGTEELPKPAPRQQTETVTGAPASNLILPPPPPMWYPPLYNPQFGVDPLNFFIDLRVSGHIYDRKRALAEGGPSASINPEGQTTEVGVDKRLSRDFGPRPRHLSAFSVPVRRSDSDKLEHNSQGQLHGTSYIMKNLKHVYDKVHGEQDQKDQQEATKAESSDIEEDI